MSKDQQPAPARHTEERPARRAEPKYLLARTRGARPFNRGGIRFGSSWNAWPAADIAPEKLKAILAEPMLDARLTTRDEVEHVVTIKHAVLDEQTPRAEIVEYVLRLERALAGSNERIAQLEARLAGDHPPAPGVRPDGSPTR